MFNHTGLFAHDLGQEAIAETENNVLEFTFNPMALLIPPQNLS
jgi:hypothetical protein